jgi:hypothetical protein
VLPPNKRGVQLTSYIKGDTWLYSKFENQANVLYSEEDLLKEKTKKNNIDLSSYIYSFYKVYKVKYDYKNLFYFQEKDISKPDIFCKMCDFSLHLSFSQLDTN